MTYLSEHSEVAQQLMAGDATIAVLPEPFVTQVTTKQPDCQVALDLTEEWDKVAAAACCPWDAWWSRVTTGR